MITAATLLAITSYNIGGLHRLSSESEPKRKAIKISESSQKASKRLTVMPERIPSTPVQK